MKKCTYHISVYRDAATIKLWHLYGREVTTDIYDVKLDDWNYSLAALQHRVYKYDFFRLAPARGQVFTECGSFRSTGA